MHTLLAVFPSLCHLPASLIITVPIPDENQKTKNKKLHAFKSLSQGQIPGESTLNQAEQQQQPELFTELYLIQVFILNIRNSVIMNHFSCS